MFVLRDDAVRPQITEWTCSHDGRI
jgi:hypothetical protein